MKKKTLLFTMLGLVVVVVLVFAQFAVAQAWTGDETLDNIYGQIHELRKQVVERRVELGQLTTEEGQAILQRMDEQYQYRLENGGAGFFCHGREGAAGLGRMGFGQRMGFRGRAW